MLFNAGSVGPSNRRACRGVTQAMGERLAGCVLAGNRQGSGWKHRFDLNLLCNFLCFKTKKVEKLRDIAASVSTCSYAVIAVLQSCNHKVAVVVCSRGDSFRTYGLLESSILNLRSSISDLNKHNSKHNPRYIRNNICHIKRSRRHPQLYYFSNYTQRYRGHDEFP